MNKFLKANTEFWTQDRSLAALLIYLIIYIFFTLPFVSNGFVQMIVGVVVFSLILLSGVFTVMGNYPFKITMVALAVVTFGIRWAVVIKPASYLLLAETIFTIVFLGSLAVFMLTQVFREGHFNLHRIQGAVAVFLLIGLIWAYLYEAVYLTDSGAFTFPPEIEGFYESFFTKFLYFSFITLTTLGYGDITPMHPIAKSLVMMEGLMGILYPAIMITRLVGLEIESRKARHKS